MNMKWLLFLTAVLSLFILLLLLQRFTTLEFVKHARLLFKTWSLWLTSFGSMLSAWVQSFPASALDAWKTLPPDIKAVLPHNYLGMIGAFMVAMGIMAQFVRQKKLADKRSELEDKS